MAIFSTTGSDTFPAGHILQVQSTTKVAPQSTVSATYVTVTDSHVAITPTVAGSNILVMVSTSLGAGTSDAQGSLELQVDIASGGYNTIGGGTASGSRVSGIAQSAGDVTTETNQVGYSFLHDPTYTLTNVLTYRLRMKSQNGGYGIYLGSSRSDGNADYNTRMPTTVTVMEIST
jgi:hypothetical protein